MCIAVGKVSLDDWDLFTSSLGCTGFLEPMTPLAISMALFEMTSFAFMFDCVPEPVCQTTSGKCASSVPAITSSAAAGDQLLLVLGQQAQVGVGRRGGLLEHAHRADHLARQRVAAGAGLEMMEGALGLRAPVAVSATGISPIVSFSRRVLAVAAIIP